jgi:hypothetical protein
MSRIGRVGISTLLLLTAAAAVARADDITTKKLFIKDSTDPAKRQIQVQSIDPNVLMSKVDDPGAHGASLHFYSATDNFCVILPAGTDWVNKNNKAWKYKNKTTKNAAQVKNGKFGIKIKSGVTYTLADNGTQGTVNAQVQFGTGTRYCMRCTGNKKDDVAKFLGSACAAATCDPEPSPCESEPNCANTPTGLVVKGSLPSSLGRFNYDSHVGLQGAINACSSPPFAGAHPCTYQELLSAPTSDLACLKDTANPSNPVTSFWAIDPNAPALQQCNDDAIGGSGLNWEYATAHTASRGQKVTLDPNGVLGPLQTSVQCNIGGESWVACCQ